MYRVKTVCHENLDNRYVEGIKIEYFQMDSTTRVQAICDYKTKKGNANGVKCAGAAEIIFQVQIIIENYKTLNSYNVKLFL